MESSLCQNRKISFTIFFNSLVFFSILSFQFFLFSRVARSFAGGPLAFAFFPLFSWCSQFEKKNRSNLKHTSFLFQVQLFVSVYFFIHFFIKNCAVSAEVVDFVVFLLPNYKLHRLRRSGSLETSKESRSSRRPSHSDVTEGAFASRWGSRLNQFRVYVYIYI